jgi:hypothetical protein
MKKLDLKITRANIKNGERTNPGKCPIANSVLDNVNNIIYVSILPDEATIKVKNGRNIVAYRGKMPKKAFNFVRNFDDGFKVKPFALTLELNKLDKKIAEIV